MLYLLEISCIDKILFGQKIKSRLSSWTENPIYTYKICMNKTQNMKKVVVNQVLYQI